MMSAYRIGRDQPDLFGAPLVEPLDAETEPVAFRGDPDRVRTRLEGIIAQARSADTLPWSRRDVALYRTIVPQMTLWLPDDEAAQWQHDFEAELSRLNAR